MWNAKDKSGNKANATQTVFVKDTTPPKITPPANITFEATSLDNNIISLGNATATDIEPVTITNNRSKKLRVGKKRISRCSKYHSKKTSNTTQTVDVVQTIPPKITP